MIHSLLWRWRIAAIAVLGNASAIALVVNALQYWRQLEIAVDDAAASELWAGIGICLGYALFVMLCTSAWVAIFRKRFSRHIALLLTIPSAAVALLLWIFLPR
jgi:hypothetical protein